MKSSFYVILFDIIGSTKSSNRPLITDKLTEAVQKTNQIFKQQCYAPFEITKGDEVAAVLLSIKNAYDIISMFTDLLSPIKTRTVIVYDELTAGLETQRSTVIDGPAFYKANLLMIELKKLNKYFSLSSGEQELDKIIKAFINIYINHWNQLTKLQQKVIRLYQKEKNQIKVANILKRKQQQIQYTLTRCKWEIIDDAEKAISILFKDIDDIVRQNEK